MDNIGRVILVFVLTLACSSGKAQPVAPSIEQNLQYSTGPIANAQSSSPDQEGGLEIGRIQTHDGKASSSDTNRPEPGGALEVVQLPKSKIPLRLLQRNRWHAVRRATEASPDESGDTTVPEPVTTAEAVDHQPVTVPLTLPPIPNLALSEELSNISPSPAPIQYPRLPFDNMIIENSKSNLGTSGRKSHGLSPDSQGLSWARNALPTLHIHRQPVPSEQNDQIQEHSPSDDYPQQQRPILRRPSDPAPKLIPHFDTPLPEDINIPSSLNDTDTNDTTPIPLPIPLDKVPFHMRPQQEIQNRILEAEWKKSGLKLEDYLTTTTPKPNITSTTSTPSTTSSSTASTTTVMTTTDGPLNMSDTSAPTDSPTTTFPVHDYLMRFLANRNSNVRAYLKAILEDENVAEGDEEQKRNEEHTTVTQDQGDDQVEKSQDDIDGVKLN